MINLNKSEIVKGRKPMKCLFKRAALYVALMCIAVTVCPFGAHAAEYESFIRIDRDDPKAYDRELENLRIITGDMYAFKELNEKYGISKEYTPVETGLDTLDVSASAQFNIPPHDREY